MAVPVEGYTVIVKKHRIQNLLDEGIIESPNSRSVYDKELWACSFMAKADAQALMVELEKNGLNTTQGPESDAVTVTEFDQTIYPYCEWLLTGKWEKAVLAWKEGTEPKTVCSYEGWDPEVGSGLTFHDPETMDNLEFLRLEENNVEVYFNKEIGKEVYIGRSTPPYESMFKSATELIWKNSVTAGQKALSGKPSEEVNKAIKLLREILEGNEPSPQVYFFLAKGYMALGNPEESYHFLHEGLKLDPENESIIRELGGVCLDLKKYEEAISINETSLGFAPDNIELLGNLALAYLMGKRLEEAEKAIIAATKISNKDSINNLLLKVINEVKVGTRAQPETLADITKPANKIKKKFWEFWK